MADLIGGFIRELRARGLEISPAERIDAGRALKRVGLESRSLFRAALRTTLAKSLDAQDVFDDVFQSHFATPRPGRVRRKGRAREGGPGAGRRRQPEGQGAGRPPPTTPPRRPRERPWERPARPGRRPAGPEAGKDRPEGPTRAGRLKMVVGRREPPRAGPPGLPRPPELRRRDFVEPMDREEEAALAASIAGIVREIRLRSGRRFGRGRKGRLWVKRMVRDSLRQGGIPFTLPMRQRRPRRPRVTLLVDVSWSVSRAAGLFLMICRQLSDLLGSPEVHLFVDRVVEATREVERWTSGGTPAAAARPVRGRRSAPGSGLRPAARAASFEELLQSLPGLDPAAPSDYGRAFYQAGSMLLPSAGRDRVLVVLGDARTNRRDPLPWAFEGLASACRRVIWLNPEPRARWDTGDSEMSSYLPACDVACEIRDLDGLTRGVREMVRSL